MPGGRDEIILEAKGYFVSLGQLFDFLNGEYKDLVNPKELVDEVDYIGVLDYLENNMEIPYVSPDNNDVSLEERKHLLEMEKKGEWVLKETRKIANKSKALFDIDTYDGGSWLDASGTKTKKKLSIQMKYQKYFESPISISFYVEKDEDDVRFRISLDVKNDGISKQVMDKYHSHLEMPLGEGMSYGIRSNRWGNPEITLKSAEELKNQIEDGEIRKVQICVYVQQTADKTNSQYDKEVMAAIEKLIPYYEHVINTDNSEWWPSLSIFNPEISSNQWYEFLDEKYKDNAPVLMLLKTIMDNGAASCKRMAEIMGGSPYTYNARAVHFGNSVKEYFDVDFDVVAENGLKVGPTSIPFLGRVVNGLYEWKLRDELKEALEKMDLSNLDNYPKVTTRGYDKNTILYGPPGTGKTYNSATIAVAICDNKNVDDLTDYQEVMDRYNELKKEGRIAFTTFHQSYGYEEFIEGIKPVLGEGQTDISYKVEDGVFKKFCEDARKLKLSSDNTRLLNDNPRIWGMLLDGTGMTATKEYCFNNNVVRLGFSEVKDEDIEGDYGTDANSTWNAKHMVDDFINNVSVGDIVVIEKTNKSIDAIGVFTGEYVYDAFKDDFRRMRSLEWLVKDIDEDMTKYLPSGRKQLARQSIFNFDYIGLQVISEILVKNGSSAIFEVEEERKPFVFVIDEINRGNISKIFGELITLIENTKREGESEAANAILPYSGKEFSVPNNVYILGTMNTADRSISLLDTALRRRFSFIEMMPNSDVLRDMGIGTITIDGTELNVADMLDVINERIKFLFDREHTIGHAFFTGLADDTSIDKLASIFEKNVIPLLQEYFYEDYQKIQLVLGDNAKQDDAIKFVVDQKIKLKELFMGNVEDMVDEQEVKYEINHDAFKNIEAYKAIANDL